MTDQEIVQALRCCADHSCSAKCPAFPAGLDCREEMHKEVLALLERLTAENAALREYAAMMHECEMCKNDSYCPVGAPTGGDCGNHHECDDCPCRDCEKTDHWALREMPGAPERGGSNA